MTQSSSAEKHNGVGHLSWLPGVAALLAFIACHCLFVIVFLLSLVGISLVINETYQAAAISIFSLLALLFIFINSKKTRQVQALILAGLGTLLVLFSMYVFYHVLAGNAGLMMLMGAAFWSWKQSRTN